MKNICKKYGYYVGAAIGALISGWSIFKAVTSGNDCEECNCGNCEEPCEECTDEAE